MDILNIHRLNGSRYHEVLKIQCSEIETDRLVLVPPIHRAMRVCSTDLL